MDMAREFEATLWRPSGRGTQTFITLPFDVKELFGRARCPVRVTINDHTWRTTTQVYGGTYHIVVNREARSVAAREAGDTVLVLVTRDDALRTVDLPLELVTALRHDNQARAAFEQLAPSHRREYARWIGEAKRPDTRLRRAVAAVERIKNGVLRPQPA